MSAISLCKVCGSPAPLQCSGCRLVSYCGVQHQRDDWFPHKHSECRVYEIRTNAELGRHVVALRDLDEGELILTESPFVVGPRHFIPKCCCVGCCRKVDHSKTCRRCKWPICSNSCSGLRGPSSHEDECNILKTVLKACSYCPDHYLMPLRCVLLQTQNPEKWRWIEEQFTFAEAGKEGFEKDRVMSVFVSLLTPLPRGYPNLMFDCSLPTMRRLLNVLDAFALDGSTNRVAPVSGLYSVASLMPHSCASNTSLFFEDAPESPESAKFVPGRVTVKAARNIKRGEILTRNSGFSLFPTVARLGSQKVRRNFRCSCKRCKDPHENGSDLGTMRCHQCPGSVVPITTSKVEDSLWRCEGPCKMTFSAEVAANIVFHLSTQISSTLMELATVSQLEALLRNLESYLHPNHILCLSVKCRLLKMYGGGSESALNDADLARKAVLGREVVSVMDKLGPSQIHQEVVNKAQCYLELARTEAEIMKRRYAAGFLNSQCVLRAVWESAHSLRRILSFVAANPHDCLSSQYAIAMQISPEISSLLSWVKKNGMEVPEELKSFFLEQVNYNRVS